MVKVGYCVPGCTNNWRNSPTMKFHTLPSDPKVKTRQDKRATAVEGNPKAPFSLASTVTYGINRNSRQGGGATPLPLRAQRKERVQSKEHV